MFSKVADLLFLFGYFVGFLFVFILILAFAIWTVLTIGAHKDRKQGKHFMLKGKKKLLNLNPSSLNVNLFVICVIFFPHFESRF